MQLFKNVVPDRRSVAERVLDWTKSSRAIVFVMIIWMIAGFGLISHFLRKNNLQGSIITLAFIFPVFGVVYSCTRIRDITQCVIQMYQSNKKVKREKPPSYDDVMSGEAPPPAYYELFSEVEGHGQDTAAEDVADLSSSPSPPLPLPFSGELTHRQWRTSVAKSDTRKTRSFDVIYVPAIVTRLRRRLSLSSSVCGAK